MDTESTVDTLTPRLDRLERENRRLKIAGAFLVLALAAVGAMGQVLPKVVPKVVEAERFVLRDTKGNILAVLDTSGLALYDENWKIRVVLKVDASSTPGLALLDQNGEIRAALNVLPDGTPGLALLDQNGKIRAVLSVDASGPGLALLDENRRRAVLGHTALEKTATGTVEQRPASSLVLFDRDGKVIWRVP